MAGKVSDFAYLPTFRVGPVQLVKFRGTNFVAGSTTVSKIEDKSGQYKWITGNAVVLSPELLVVRVIITKIVVVTAKEIRPGGHADLMGIGNLTVTVKTGAVEEPTDMGDVNYQE